MLYLTTAKRQQLINLYADEHLAEAKLPARLSRLPDRGEPRTVDAGQTAPSNRAPRVQFGTS